MDPLQYKFSDFAKMCKMLEDQKSMPKQRGGRKTKKPMAYAKKARLILETLFKKFVSADTNVKIDCFPLLRLLLPNKDNVRSNYNVKVSKLARIYGDALELDRKDGIERAALKSPEDSRCIAALLQKYNETKGVSADFGSVLRFVLEQRWIYRRDEDERGSPTLQEINDTLDELCELKSLDERKELFKKLYADRLTPEEHVWFARIILGDLRLGLTESIVLGVFHPKAQEVFRNTYSLKKVCDCVMDDELMKKHSNSIELGTPFSYQRAAKEPNYRRMLSKMGKQDELLMEPKLDGERNSIHKNGNEFIMISRGGHKDLYGYVKCLLPFLREGMKNVDQCIIDGELMCYSGSEDRFLPFGNNRPVATAMIESRFHELSKQEQESRDRLVFVVFDVCMVDNEQFINRPLRDRKQWLRDNLIFREHAFELVETLPLERTGMSDAEVTSTLMSTLDTYMARGFEGLVIKSLEMPYVLDGKDLNNWVKLKPDMIDGYGDTIDCVILAGCFGKRTDGASKFLVGVKLTDRQDTDNKQFRIIGKVGTGYSITELDELQKRLNATGDWKHRPNKTDPLPAYFGGWYPRDTDDRPDFVMTSPEKAIVLEIRVYELTPCEYGKFSSEISMRHPRVMRIRYDKQWNDGMTMKQAQEALRMGSATRTQAGSMQARRQAAEGSSSSLRGVFSSSSLGEGSFNGSLPVLDTQTVFQPSDDFKVKKNILKGFKFCIKKFSVPYKGYSQKQIEELICSAGGKVVANPTGSILDKVTKQYKIIADVLLSPGYNNWTESYKDKGLDILELDFVLDSIEAGDAVDLEPRYIIHATTATWNAIKDTYDEYGDYYCTPTSKKRFRSAVEHSRAKKRRFRETKEKELKLNNALLPARASVTLREFPEEFGNPLLAMSSFIFVEYVFYFVHDSQSRAAMWEAKFCALRVRNFGGSVETEMSQDVTHIVVAGSLSKEEKNALFEDCESHRSDTHPVKFMVRPEFVTDCINSQRVLEPHAYAAFA